MLRRRIEGIAFGLGALAALAIGAANNSAQAEFVVNMYQDGSNIVAMGSGTIDLTDLTSLPSGAALSAFIVPTSAIIFTGGTAASDHYSGFTGPSSFGIGGVSNAASGTGDFVGLQGATTQAFLLVPVGYVSGNSLSDTSTYENATFSSLGVTPGTYTWTWGSGADADSFVLNIGVPGPASAATFAPALLGLVAIRRRRRKAV